MDRLSAAMGHPETDPHGDPIPNRDGELRTQVGTPLSAWPVGEPARIVHLEDEPPLAFAQLAALGLRPGQIVRVLETSPTRLMMSDGENEHVLAPMLAGNVHVVAAARAELAARSILRLSDLTAGQLGEVVELDPGLRGFMRRRLLDLGFTPGARVRPDLTTFAGDPRASLDEAVRDGLFAYPWGGGELQISAGSGEDGAIFELSSKDIILFKKHPEAISARNLHHGPVVTTFAAGNKTGVEIDCGGERLVAEVVSEAARELDIRKGGEVFAAIKASAFRRLC